MSVTLTWACDEPGCTTTAIKVMGEPKSLSTPVGWTPYRTGDEWLHRCPQHAAPTSRPSRGHAWAEHGEGEN